MADIRKRSGSKGITYQVRYPSKASKSGYAYKTFLTLKEARAFREDSSTRNATRPRHAEITTVDQAVQRWMDICEHEGRDGRDPVSPATLAVYKGSASIMRAYPWEAQLHELQSTDLVAFRSWLLKEYTRDQAKRTLSCFHSMLIEMVTQGVLTTDPAGRITIQRSRYQEPVEIPSIAEVQSILAAADRLANHKYKYISQPWQRYRAMVYLASDSGLRPQEYLALPTADLLERGIRVTQAVSRSNRIEVPKSPAARRYLPIGTDVLGMTRHYVERHEGPNVGGLVYPGEHGGHQQYGHFSKRCWRTLMKEAGLVQQIEIDGEKRLQNLHTPYSLRHFYASMLIADNKDLKTIQERLGHVDAAMTLNVYGHLIKERQAKAREEDGGILGRILSKECSGTVPLLNS
jgi:site-specific recombinase XerD